MSTSEEQLGWQTVLDSFRDNLKEARFKESLARESAVTWSQKINWVKREAHQRGIELK